MDVQVTHTLNPAPPISLAQAKANLLQFGEATAGAHGEFGKNALWLSIAAAVAGIVITGFAPRHKHRADPSYKHRGFTLLSLLPLLKPLLPIVLQYLAKHKAAREQAQQTAAI